MTRALLLLALACRDEVTTTETGTTTSTTATSVVRDAKFDGAVNVVLQDLDRANGSGVSIAVCEAGIPTWVEGFGSADPDGDVPVNPDMVFQIGSTTKHMTATVALQQVEAGWIGLDDAVDVLLPNFSLLDDPGWSEDATLRHLLTHQGGLVDYLDWTQGPDDAGLAEFMYEFFPMLYAMAPPGAFWNYSNPNFSMAGLVIEEHDPAGRAWPDIVTEDVFVPLGMTHSFNRNADAQAYGNYALSWGISNPLAYEYGTILMEDLYDPASGRPAGSSTWSTPSDMCKWGQFLLHGDPDVLGDALRTELATPQVSTLCYDDHYSYGLGLFVWDQSPWTAEEPYTSEWYELPMIEHGGNTLSYSSVFVLLPEQDTVISILSNGWVDNYGNTTNAIVRAVVNPWPSPTGYEPAFDEAAVAEHVGSYFDPYNVGDVEVTAGGPFGLQVSMPIAEQFGVNVDPNLVPLSTDVWVVTIDGVPYEITFVDGETGPSTYIRNRAFVATRAPVGARQVPPAGPSGPPRLAVPGL